MNDVLIGNQHCLDQLLFSMVVCQLHYMLSMNQRAAKGRLKNSSASAWVSQKAHSYHTCHGNCRNTACVTFKHKDRNRKKSPLRAL